MSDDEIKPRYNKKSKKINYKKEVHKKIKQILLIIDKKVPKDIYIKLNELDKKFSLKGYFFYLLMYSIDIPKKDIKITVGFYNIERNRVKTASLVNSEWKINEDEDKIISNQTPKPLDLDDTKPFNEIIKRLNEILNEEILSKVNKIFATISNNNKPLWNILLFQDKKTTNIKLNASTLKMITNKDVSLIKRNGE